MIVAGYKLYWLWSQNNDLIIIMLQGVIFTGYKEKMNNDFWQG